MTAPSRVPVVLGRGVEIDVGGDLTNAASASITGTYVGVVISGSAGYVSNYGIIRRITGINSWTLSN